MNFAEIQLSTCERFKIKIQENSVPVNYSLVIVIKHTLMCGGGQQRKQKP